MENSTRTKNSARNIVFSVISNLTNILLMGVIRIFFVRYFAVEYLGLNSLFANILSILSITESGFGAAIVFAMYKPMAEQNSERIRRLLAFYKKAYFIIFLIILALGLGIIPFLRFIVKDYNLLDVNFYVVYSLFLANTLCGFFVAHRRSLFITNQRIDIEQKINFVCYIIASVLQLLSIIVFKNFYFYVLSSLISTIINSVLVLLITNKKFPELVLKTNNKLEDETKKSIKKNVAALITHKIGGVVLSGTDSIVISVFLGLTILGKYSNYLLITTCLATILNLLINSFQGSIGNSIATQSSEVNFKLFEKLDMLFLWIVGFFSIGILTLSSPFIGFVFGQEYALDNLTVIIIAFNFYLRYIRSVVYSFKECKGLFWENRYMPIIEALVNLVISIVLVQFIGLIGVILGTIISGVVMPLWFEPYILNKTYFKQNGLWYIKIIAPLILSTLISAIACWVLVGLIPSGNIWWLILKFIVVILVSNLLIFVLSLYNKGFRGMLKFIKEKVKQLLGGKQEK